MSLLANEALLECGGLLAAGYSIYQSTKLHSAELEKAQKRHKEAIELAIDQHKRNLTEEKRTFLLELFNNLEQHFQQLNADLIASGKESERDMFDQRNQSLQTLILASSVMFTGLITAITNSSLPLPTSAFMSISFAVTTSMAFLFLFICIVVCIELIIRSSNFMYKRARKHGENLKQAIRETTVMMRTLYGGEKDAADNSERLSDADVVEAAGGGVGRAESKKSWGGGQSNKIGVEEGSSYTRKRRGIVDMSGDYLEKEWTGHEIKIQNFMLQREQINDRTAVIDHTAHDRNDSEKMSFQDFWRESCKVWATLAILFFYFGTLCLLLNIMLYMYAQFTQTYDNQPSALIAVLLIGCALGLAVLLALLMRMYGMADLVAGGSEMRSLSSMRMNTQDSGMDWPSLGGLDEELGGVSTRGPMLHTETGKYSYRSHML